MSVLVMSWVFKHSESRGNDRLVLLAIADRASDDGTDAWPSLATIAEKAHVSRRTAIRSIQALEDLGELAVERSTGGHSTNSYRVVMDTESSDSLTPPGGDNLTPRQIVTGDTGVTAEVTLLSPNTSLRPSTPQPPASGGVEGPPKTDHCKRHRRHRKDCGECAAAKADSTARPAWCGGCDQRTRQLEDPITGAVLGRCPDCHPLRKATA